MADPIFRPLKPARMSRKQVKVWEQCGHYRESIRLLRARIDAGALDAEAKRRAERTIETLRRTILALESEL